MICERMLTECALASPLSFVALRYFNATGADPEGEIGPCQVPATNAIHLLLDAASGQSPGFTIYGDDYSTADGTGVRDYIHVTDLADAHVKALSALLAGVASTSNGTAGVLVPMPTLPAAVIRIRSFATPPPPAAPALVLK